MSERNRERNDPSRFTRPVSTSHDPTSLDCKAWDADVPAERWFTGKMVSVPRVTQAGPEGAFVPVESLNLEIALRISTDAKPAEAFAIATELFAAVLAHGLNYDRAHSEATADRIVIVLTPGDPGRDLKARLEKLAKTIRSAMRNATGIALSEVRVRAA